MPSVSVTRKARDVMKAFERLITNGTPVNQNQLVVSAWDLVALEERINAFLRADDGSQGRSADNSPPPEIGRENAVALSSRKSGDLPSAEAEREA